MTGSARVLAGSQYAPVLNIRRHLLRATLRAAALVATDLLALLAAFPALLALLLPVVARDPAAGSVLPRAELFAALVLALHVTGSYGAGDRRRDPVRVLLASMLALLLPLWGALWEVPVAAAGRLAAASLVLAAALAAGRLLLDALLRRAKPTPRPVARTLLVGPGADCIEMCGRAAFGEENGFDLVGFVDTDGDADAPATGGVRGPALDLARVLEEQEVDTVLLCGRMTDASLDRIIKAAIAAECEVLAVARQIELAGVRPAIIWRQGQPLLELRGEALRAEQLACKRMLDIAVAAAALVLLWPVMLGIAIAVRLESAGPAVFGQARVGRHGRIFKCLKFRSMYPNAEQLLRADPALHAEYVRNDFKLPAEIDARITRVGRILRKTSLDELPQLWNVLRGNMSLVGPRPVVPDELRHYMNEEPLLLSLKPGVTGAWQVNGRSSVPYPRRAHMELEYVQTWSLARDVGILLRTVPAVLAQRGAH